MQKYKLLTMPEFIVRILSAFTAFIGGYKPCFGFG